MLVDPAALANLVFELYKLYFQKKMMQKCSRIAHSLMKQSVRLSLQTVRLSSSSKVMKSSEIASDDNFKDSKDKVDIEKLSRRDYRYIFPEFLPDPHPDFRNSVSEKLQRRDMLARRDLIEIPGPWHGWETIDHRLN